MKVNDGTIVVEVQQHALQKVKEQLAKAVDVRNVRGITQFFGLGKERAALSFFRNERACIHSSCCVIAGEEKPFNIPGREVLATRARKNAVFFSANYAISAALVGVVTM